MCIEEHGRKVLQMENGQFQYARKKIDLNLQRDIMQNKGFKDKNQLEEWGSSHLLEFSMPLDLHNFQIFVV